MVDWFTVVCQIGNFVLLVLLLRWLLYKRVIRAMDERQKRIDAELSDAQEAKASAQAEAESLHQTQQALEEGREALMAEARADADARRAELMAQAETDVTQQKAQWLEAVQRQREQFLQTLRQNMAEKLSAVARKALADLADVDLERQVVAAFLQRLGQLPDDQHEALVAAAGKSDRPLVVRTAWELADDQKGQITDAAGALAGGKPLAFEQAADVVCGIELVAEGQAVGWSVGRYLDDITDALNAAIGRQTQAPQETSS
jgi:F-type H+-transporting ATPase subunit b